jgi:tellurite resistance protein TerC
MNEIINKGIQHAKRIIVAVIGATVLLAGLFMIVLPGPAVIVIPAGLAILASEFVWARRLMRNVKKIIMEKPGQKK